MVEIHIPKKGIHGRLEPIAQPAEDELPDDLQILRAMEEHETLAITHLERSNTELKAALAEMEDDADFQIAVIENLAVLSQKKKLLEQVREKIKELDPNAVISAAPVPSKPSPVQAAAAAATANPVLTAAGAATRGSGSNAGTGSGGAVAGPPVGGLGGMAEEEEEEEETGHGGVDVGGLHL
mmetsp:Transcript_27323/g.41298  ORF Transcript_27323/g.41298 Transcript_27323/m.41298 type:complete len:182 (-) Transcript_27323:80-625(-)|eukprot:CAMPEP_0194765108 /NCGR_PEP_ID=MMETSP0323_2-20130528/24911_1 /TAXON_ID=2866 ORGANISM="Crypthecodinium cohnii, Strain Seligo" /NCGR_SAMPLE_ID=MMETSP0323_2 /ASSEMBLY_ACC=CAM_ASM_000346 /LENGTH=181 /DNA_ID=CAMNT_0039693779 /DNA_START=65 /DNA_END=610 /DNA_ORIENTATION=+